MKKVLGLLLITTVLVSCTDNKMARSYGGTETITLEPGERLVEATWKETNLWYLTKMDSTTKPTTYIFKEKSAHGIWEGTVVFEER